VIFYRILYPLVAASIYFLAVLRGRETWADTRQRLRGPRVAGPSVWLHGASVGEVNAARPLVEEILAARPDLAVLVTATTLTGRAAVADWGLARVTAGLAPLDMRFVTSRLLRACKVRAVLVMENEMWPQRLLECHRQHVPVILLNARMSEKSARIWSRFHNLARRILSPVALAAPQDPGSAARLQDLGVPAAAMLPALNLKALYVPKGDLLPPDVAQIAPGNTILAAATHEGEEDIVLQAFAQARSHRPELRLIIAPRHPGRGDAVASMVNRTKLTLARRSKGDSPDAAVYLADTMGEMSLWYRASGLVFVGGSLVNAGGHTPFEPVAYNCPILHGPHVANFAEPYAKLAAVGGAVVVRDAAALADAMLAHLGDHAMAQRAKTALTAADITQLLRRLLPLIPR
jgi:3-deoxy-D-manno-octulosonic-acid transferase